MLVDNEPFEGQNIYRLDMLDAEGNTLHSSQEIRVHYVGGRPDLAWPEVVKESGAGKITLRSTDEPLCSLALFVDGAPLFYWEKFREGLSSAESAMTYSLPVGPHRVFLATRSEGAELLRTTSTVSILCD